MDLNRRHRHIHPSHVQAGLGKMIWDARLYMLIDQIFVALVLLGLLGFTTDRLFRWGIYAFAGRYSPVT